MSARKPIIPTGEAVTSRRILLLTALIGSITLSVFWGATRCGFLNLDDDLYVTANPRVSGGLSFHGIAYAFTTVDGGSWMPLTWLSYLLDASVWGNNAAGYHATNILLHAASASLLLLALVMLTRRLWPSAFVALFFALHPLRVESVIWIAERKDVLSGLFFMLTLAGYARFTGKDARGNHIPVSLARVNGQTHTGHGPSLAPLARFLASRADGQFMGRNQSEAPGSDHRENPAVSALGGLRCTHHLDPVLRRRSRKSRVGSPPDSTCPGQLPVLPGEDFLAR